MDEYESVAGFLEYADDLEDLMGSRFGVTKNALDQRDIQSITSD
jgi:hypothetical protein